MIGFLHIKDLYPLIVKNKPVNISSILREAFYIPETMPVDKLALEFQRRHTQMAIVMDEFGGTSGLVTHEDVLEEIFGEVQDEFDEEESEIKEIAPDEYEICAKMRTDEFCEFFDIKLEDEDVKTIGGYVVKKLGKIAQVNDEVQDEFFKYCVTETDSTRVVKLRIEKLNKINII